MHIGIISSEYPHPEVKFAAGIATSIKNLAITLVEKHWRVTIFVYGQDTNDIINDNGVTIHLIKSRKKAFLGWYFYRKDIQNYVNRIVQKDSIDILEAPDWTGITAFSRFTVPLIIRFHGSDAYFCKLENRKQRPKNFWFEKSALRRATAYIAPTTYAGKETAKIFGLDPRKIKTIHYGLQLENFTNLFPDKFDKNTILYIGTIIRKKGVFELAQIFNKVHQNNPKAKLVLIGGDATDLKTGAESTFLEIKKEFSSSANKNVEYLGRIPYTQVQEHIKNAAICVFPSFAETLGMVTIESMALQKPVVNTSIGWAQELIDDGVNGYLIHPNNIDDYADRINELLDNEELILTIGKAARSKVENTFDINKIADENIAYYNSFIQ